ncbi:hypothetical protein CE91St54_43130 [Hungatella hathewayi]|uniref:Uncharacterized protein n=1 Tax=Hungatella hathewayi TaxID=154046 RepID=A0AA37JK76_9FIRM|nr:MULTISPECIES: hypothetical protein [Clostridia]GKH02714.1 hypothetical protein CE91St55_46950 [Hungatella hathewayi]GKH09205.1 hypothetical protein CE91St54_43130 [Hungatella hathewayi]
MRTNKMKNSTELFSKYGISAEDILEKKEKTSFKHQNCIKSGI